MLPRLLFRLIVGLSLVLMLLVIAAPLLQGTIPQTNRWARILEVFAHDPTLRRTASAGAIGLLVTACVFFRQPEVSGRPAPKQRKIPPPQDMAGA